MKRAVSAIGLVLIAVLTLGLPAGAKENPAPQLRWETRLYSQIVGIQPSDVEGVGPGQQGRHEEFCGEAGEAGRGVSDKDISCDDALAPDNEIAIAAHPTDPDLLLAGSNDYQLFFRGNAVIIQVPAGYFLSQDGGATWLDGELPLKGSIGGGDPVPYFDLKHEQLVFTSLSFVCGQFAPLCSRGNILFASASLDQLTGDGETTDVQWRDVTVANGSGADGSAQQIFLDKEWMTVDNNPLSPHFGNIYVTFTRFRIESFVYDESPIWFTKSEDGGRNWTLPVEISGRNPVYCTFQDDPDDSADTQGPASNQGNAEGPDDPVACDQDQFSIPVVAPNGDLYVHFHNEQNLAAYELPQRYDSQVMFVKSTDGGDTWAGEQPTAANQAGCVRQPFAAEGVDGSCIVPQHIVNLEDSYDTTTHGGETPIPDYPINVSGRTTLTGHQFRVNSAGNMAIGPGPGPLGYRVWVTFADNLHGLRPGPGQTEEGSPDFVPVTDTEVFYAFSDDGGTTWVGGDALGVSGPGRLMVHPEDPPFSEDQWFPWADTNKTTGDLYVGYMDGGTFDGPIRQTYGFEVAAIPNAAAGGFDPAPVAVSSAPSNPNLSIFFRAGAPDCQFCATFIGDYNGLAVGPTGHVHSVWTDMRRPVIPSPPLATEDAFYARMPPPE